MTPTTIHRYSIPTAEAIRALLDVRDCERIDVAIVGENLVFDVVNPVGALQQYLDDTGVSEELPDEPPPPAPEAASERKGGPLARRAAMICQEGAFWRYLGEEYGATVSDKEAAKAWMLRQLGISSRADLDHDEDAGMRFRIVEGAYKFWMNGF